MLFERHQEDGNTSVRALVHGRAHHPPYPTTPGGASTRCRPSRSGLRTNFRPPGRRRGLCGCGRRRWTRGRGGGVAAGGGGGGGKYEEGEAETQVPPLCLEGGERDTTHEKGPWRTLRNILERIGAIEGGWGWGAVWEGWRRRRAGLEGGNGRGGRPRRRTRSPTSDPEHPRQRRREERVRNHLKVTLIRPFDFWCYVDGWIARPPSHPLPELKYNSVHSQTQIERRLQSPRSEWAPTGPRRWRCGT